MKRTFIIGDIHGCYDELMALTQKIGLTDNDLLISVGDIVDRGAQSVDVYRYLSTRPNTLVLMGNHERKHLNGVLSYAQDIVKLQFGETYPEFLQWVNTLGYYHETDEAIVVHAAFEHDQPLHTQREDVLCGSTAGEKHLEKKYAPDTYWSAYYQGNKPIIYGHHVVGDVPKIDNNTYGIDTGCCHGGYLTALELPGFVIHQVKGKKDYWKEEQKRWQMPVLQSKDWNTLGVAATKRKLAKLDYIDQPEARAFLDAIENRLVQLDAFLPDLKAGIDAFTQNLLAQHPETFNEAALSYDFKTFLFKSKAQNLTVDDLRKTLDTPHKIISLARRLGMQNIPECGLPAHNK